MGFTIESSVPVITVFLQGLLSFFSPCVMPLVPLYVSYLAGGMGTTDEDGRIHYPRKQVFINTIFFVLGISFTFFLLGFGFTALGQFFNRYQTFFARIGGIIMILFGLYQLGVFGHSMTLEREHRLPFALDRWTMGPIPALLLGFTFSFAWTPCVGPTLSSVLLMAGSAASQSKAFLLIGVYTIGFILPFLAVGLFTSTVLSFFKKHQNILRYTVKAGAILLILMGIMTLTGFMNGITGYLSEYDGIDIGTITETESETAFLSESSPEESQTDASMESETEIETTTAAEPETIPAPDFTLYDQYGKEHTLSDYKGKTIFMNFWATWCPPCRQEMPDIQQLYEDFGYNEGDLVVIGIAGPGIGQEGTSDEVIAFLEENEYTFPVLMDESGLLFYQYGISAFPTTFMIDQNGNVFGYVQGAITRSIMDSIIDQTMRMEYDQ